MSSQTLTLEQVEELAIRLPQEDQRALITRISRRLGDLSGMPSAGDHDLPKPQNEIRSFVERVKASPVQTEGPASAVEDLRRIRDERTSRN